MPKLNPAYRAKLAERRTWPRCAYCERRKRYLDTYPNPWTGIEMFYHKACYPRAVALYDAQQARAAAMREAERQKHLAIKDYWSNPPAWQPTDGTPGSGEYNAKHGYER